MDSIPLFFNSYLEDHAILPSLKRKKRNDIDRKIKEKIDRIKELGYWESPCFSLSALSRFQGYRDLRGRLKSLDPLLKKQVKENRQVVLKEASKIWNYFGELDQRDLENIITSKQDEISLLFELTVRAKGLFESHRNALKRTFEVLSDLGKEGKAEAFSLSRVTSSKRAKLFHDFSDQEVFTQFLIEEKSSSKIFTIATSCLLNAKSPYFYSLLNPPFKEGLRGFPIKIGEINITSFERLKKWIEAPSPDHFDDLKMEEILYFVEMVHRFQLSKLMVDCDHALQKKVQEETEFSRLFILIEQLRALMRSGMYEKGSFSRTLWGLSLKLKSLGLYLSSSQSSDFPLDLCSDFFEVGFSRSFLPCLRQFFQLTLLKESEIHLSLTHLLKLKKTYINSFLKNLPQTKGIHILIQPSQSAINWNFLKDFTNLERVMVSFSEKFPLCKSLGTFKERFPLDISTEKGWHLEFKNLNAFKLVEQYSEDLEIPEKRIRGKKSVSEMSIDDFIQLEIWKGGYTRIFSEQGDDYSGIGNQNPYRYEIETLLNDVHIQKLIEYHKFDPGTTSLSISNCPLTNSPFISLLSSLPNLKTLSLFNVPDDIYSLSLAPLPKLPRLKKVTLPIEALINLKRPFLINFIRDESRTLQIVLNQQFLVRDRTFSHLFKALFNAKAKARVEFSDEIGADHSIIIENNVCTYKTTERNLEKKRENSFSNLFRIASEFFLPELDLTCVYSKKTFELISEWSFIKSIKLRENYRPFELDQDVFSPLQSLSNLTILTLISQSEKSFDQWANDLTFFQEILQSLNASIAIDGFDLDKTLEDDPSYLDDFIKKGALRYKEILPNYHACLSPLFTKELKSFLEDEDLLSLKPKRVNTITFFDFSGMSKISGKALLEFLKGFPPTLRIRVHGCSKLFDEIQHGVLSLEECLYIEMLKDGFSNLLSSEEMSWVRSEMQDYHVQRLFERKKINPAIHEVTLANMPFITSQSLDLISKKLPKLTSLTLTHLDESFYQTLLYFGMRLQNIKVPIETIANFPNLFKALFNKFKLTKQTLRNLSFQCDNMEKASPLIPDIILSYSNMLKRKGVHINFLFKEGSIKADHTSFCTLSLKVSTLRELLLDIDDEKLNPLSMIARKLNLRLNLMNLKDFSSWDASKLLGILSKKFTCEWLDLGINLEFLSSEINYQNLKNFRGLEWITIDAPPKQNFEAYVEELSTSSLLDTLRSMNVSCFINYFGINTKSIKNFLEEYEDFMNKSKVLKGLLPNFNAFGKFPPTLGFGAHFKDEHLLLLKPEKFPEGISLNFSGFTQISLRALSQFVQGMCPNYTLSLTGCSQLEKDIANLTVSVDEFLDVEILREGYSTLLLDKNHPYRPLLEDYHLQRLEMAKKIPINLKSFDLVGMPKITKHGLLFLLRTGLPNLKSLNLSGCDQIKEETIDHIKKKYPGLIIQHEY